MALVVAGALLLVVSYIAGWTSSNLVLLTGLIIIILGAALHIRQLKKGACLTFLTSFLYLCTRFSKHIINFLFSI